MENFLVWDVVRDKDLQGRLYIAVEEGALPCMKMSCSVKKASGW